MIIILASVVNLNFTLPQCSIDREDERFDCFPEDGSNENDCLSRGCCWSPPKRGIDGIQSPYCYFPQNFPHYKVIPDKAIIESHGASYYLSKPVSTFRKNEVLDLVVDLFYDTEKRLRVLIYDRNKSRYEVPVDVDNNLGIKLKQSSNVDYYVNIVDEPFAIKVYRKSTESLL
jgi:lysosomal alpha-glucosidase